MSDISKVRSENVLLVFTDGASEGNPGPGGWAFVCVGPLALNGSALESTKETEVFEDGARVTRTTNNRMELTAAIEGVSHAAAFASRGFAIRVYSDSSYVVDGISRWLPLWLGRGWKTAAGGEVLNRDLWEKLSDTVAGHIIEWNLVEGHRGVSGNEHADALATAFASGSNPLCYKGTLAGYSIPILELPKPRMAADGKTKSKRAYSYVSFVDGKVVRHESWEDCERRVKGKSGARFRKTFSPEDEARIIADWGRG